MLAPFKYGFSQGKSIIERNQRGLGGGTRIRWANVLTGEQLWAILENGFGHNSIDLLSILDKQNSGICFSSRSESPDGPFGL